MNSFNLLQEITNMIELTQMHATINDVKYINGKLINVEVIFVIQTINSGLIPLGKMLLYNFVHSTDKVKNFTYESFDTDFQNKSTLKTKCKVTNIFNFKQLMLNEILQYNSNIVGVNITQAMSLNQIQHNLLHVEQKPVIDDFEI